MFATLTGGVFLTGFALYLGMNEFLIGLLASMPFLVTIFQLPASYIIERSGNRRKISFWAAASARLIWLPIVIVALIPISPITTKLFVILTLVFVSSSMISISYVAWLSWMSDLVPDEIRGSFFGTRNMLCGAGGMVAMVVFGHLVDHPTREYSWGLPVGFVITFATAVFFGMVSLRFLNRISEPSVIPRLIQSPFRKRLSHPFKEANFARFLTFAFFWSCSVYFASPFFTLYFLRDLKFSYGFVATLGMISACADLIGMRVWGRISDKVRNKAIIRFASWVAVFLPMTWIMVRPGDIVMPILLHFIGGGFWAGINLCMNNLLLRISSRQDKSLFLSTYNIVGGLGAAIGPIVAGLTIKAMPSLDLHLLSWKLLPLHVIFITSTLLRLLSLHFLKYVHEPQEITVGQMVRILRSVRGLNMTNGFNYLLHPFIEFPRERRQV